MARQRPATASPAGETVLFLARWLKAPHRIGAVAPASRYLARAMARQVDRKDGIVLELGGGTGAVTRALVGAGIGPDRLVIVERDPALFRLLTSHFPGYRVLCGDAGDLVALLKPLGIAHVGTVVSSLPLLSMPLRVRQRIVEECFRLLAPAGPLIQYTYGVASPVPRREMGLVGEVTTRVWRNIPPAAVWRFRRPDAIAAVA